MVRPDADEMDLVHVFASEPQFLSGGVSSGWMEPAETPSRRIGFHMSEPDTRTPPSDPSWWLL